MKDYYAYIETVKDEARAKGFTWLVHQPNGDLLGYTETPCEDFTDNQTHKWVSGDPKCKTENFGNLDAAENLFGDTFKL